ncbi:MAG: ATPase domain-containing protein [Acidobacteriota bacterium]
MNKIKLGVKWLDHLMPEGVLVNSSTVISGPGGSGKPLIGNHFVAAWLKSGGSAVFMSLQYPNKDFIVTSLKKVTHIELSEYKSNSYFIQLDAAMSGMSEIGPNELKANMVKPDIWVKALEKAFAFLPKDGPGVLVFGSALNLLLFSPTYEKQILNQMISTVADDKTRAYLFSVSTSTKKKEIESLERAADNLIMTRSEKGPFRLFMNIIRLKDLPYEKGEIEVPIPSGVLMEVKEVADYSRKRVIPTVSKI